MNSEEHDELWSLLGKAREPRISPFFARNIVRAIREDSLPATFGSALRNWLLLRWRVAAIGGVALAAVCAISVERAPSADPVMVLASRVSSSPDYQVISHLDELLDSEQNSVWLDAAPY